MIRHSFKASDKHKRRKEVERDPAYQTLRGMNPNDVDEWVEDNVTDLQSAKAVMKVLAKAVFSTNMS